MSSTCVELDGMRERKKEGKKYTGAPETNYRNTAPYCTRLKGRQKYLNTEKCRHYIFGVQYHTEIFGFHHEN